MEKGILYFSAPWCESCGVLTPVIDQMAKEGIKIKKINIDYDAQYTEEFKVQSVPTLISTDMNGNEIKRIAAGGMTKEQVLKWFNS
jgi:thioredoxin 1|tara:strand:+ start:534 stop:791 length:258 start_codon:yes stop_codon:yes gene_type:complete